MTDATPDLAWLAEQAEGEAWEQVEISKRELRALLGRTREAEQRCCNCSFWEQRGEVGECLAAQGISRGPQHPDALAWAVAPGPGNVALFCTHAEFGCVQWQGKERVDAAP